MTQANERAATLSQMIAEEIRALMARRRMSGRQLAGQLGVSPSWVSYRLTGAQPIDVNDLSGIAKALGVGVHDLLPPPEKAAEAAGPSTTFWYPPVADRPARAGSAKGNRPAGHPCGSTGPEVSRTAYIDRAGRRRRDR